MINKILKIFNHEIWRFCKKYEEYFDARDNGSTDCPKCGNKETTR